MENKTNSNQTKTDQTHFGFRQVDENKKASLVGQVFSSVASKYDVMNDFMSAGLHRIWKDKMIDQIALIPNGEYQSIDVAGGTADIAFRILKKAKKVGAKINIEVSDINEEMLAVGKARALDKNLFSNLNFKAADGEKLPYSDASFDFYTIAFGIRNFTNVQNGLNEAFRVLKKGGKFVCLEFSEVSNLPMAKLYDLYSFNVIPKIGKLVAGDEDSYQYLVESIRKFPNQENFKKMIEKSGFENVGFKSLNVGVVAIHFGIKN
ncbi:MAG: demethylmenaquinone methyltransferase/2-methoxy-6-polyprenyl-1,4-benzoquinol methylase [Rickettsiales bacterium]|jgi:demethylmenaquinone methyltransferase/2-methoxy-6-polyprenyl-1,4-benzoquinol methylase